MSNSNQTPGAATVNAAAGTPSMATIARAELVLNNTDLDITIDGTAITASSPYVFNPSLSPVATFTVQIGSTGEYSIVFQLNDNDELVVDGTTWAITGSGANSITVTGPDAPTKTSSIATIKLLADPKSGVSSTCEIIIVGTVPIGDE